MLTVHLPFFQTSRNIFGVRTLSWHHLNLHLKHLDQFFVRRMLLLLQVNLSLRSTICKTRGKIDPIYHATRLITTRHSSLRWRKCILWGSRLWTPLGTMTFSTVQFLLFILIVNTWAKHYGLFFLFRRPANFSTKSTVHFVRLLGKFTYGQIRQWQTY